ncbi:MAG: ATP synthase subunit C [Gammaproteobacteria bacterium]|jgi:V/A-type H+-transporting ATPase subunit K
MSRKIRNTAVLLVLVTTAASVLLTAVLWTDAWAAAENAATVAAPVMSGNTWVGGLIAAALATGMSSLAAGIAVGRVGSAAVGAMAEKPELFGRLLILVGLAEGIAIYGLIISILILNRLV